jgi:NAD(P)-dependent dehydrogenase (short-subunit alcohol dehydrogenase family)
VDEFHHSIVLVTGGGSGIGEATAGAFARAGATVVVADLNRDRAHSVASGLGSRHLAVSGDVACEADVVAMVQAAQDRYGRIDVVVNSAGIPDSFKPTVEQDLAHWRRLIDVHLTGTYLVSRTAAPGMLARRKGVVLTVSSVAGVLGLSPRNAYSAAKAGIGMLTRTLACEWAADGVRVNCIAPGYMMTPFAAALVREGKLDADRIRRRTPMGRFGSAQDIADAMLFLASDQAKFITGVTLPVDGGYMAFGAAADAYAGPLEELTLPV